MRDSNWADNRKDRYASAVASAALAFYVVSNFGIWCAGMYPPTSADLLLWDEPLNYVDIDAREQIEAVLLRDQPTVIFVEHDARFVESVVTKELKLSFRRSITARVATSITIRVPDPQVLQKKVDTSIF